MMINVQVMQTGQLLQMYRETLLALGSDVQNKQLAHLADQLEEEISRRMAW